MSSPLCEDWLKTEHNLRWGKPCHGGLEKQRGLSGQHHPKPQGLLLQQVKHWRLPSLDGISCLVRACKACTISRWGGEDSISFSPSPPSQPSHSFSSTTNSSTLPSSSSCSWSSVEEKPASSLGSRILASLSKLKPQLPDVGESAEKEEEMSTYTTKPPPTSPSSLPESRPPPPTTSRSPPSSSAATPISSSTVASKEEERKETSSQWER